MTVEESISLEETNKIRISLGLKPLTDDKAPADDKEKQAEENYAKTRERETKERETARIAKSIAKVRNKRELHASLSGVTLGDPEAADEDNLKWIKKAKKRERVLAKKRQQELENRDSQFQEEYTEKDLVGLKVSHDMDDALKEGEDQILTLKDSRILDNEEDELHNVEMAEHERTQKTNESKIKKRNYTGYDDEEFTDGKHGMKRSILSKYDEELAGASESGFRLGANAAKGVNQTEGILQDSSSIIVNKKLLSIDYAKNEEASDYLKEGDKGFKKPKSKKNRPSRRVPDGPDELTHRADGGVMEVAAKMPAAHARNFDLNFVDDDDLQAALARQRRAKLSQKKKLSPEEIARQVAEERAQTSAVVPDSAMQILAESEVVPADNSGLTFDDTSEFVRSISYTPIIKTESVDTRILNSSAQANRAVKQEEDQVITELETGDVEIKQEEEEEDEGIMLDEIEQALKSADVEMADGDLPNGGEGDVGTAAQQNHGSGLAATLSLLRQGGVLPDVSNDAAERERTQKQRDLWLAQHRARWARQELEKTGSRGGNKDQATREYENRMRELHEARDNVESFKAYKPDVNIVYYDEFGRQMSVKEAWKALSHRFHGKSSGRMKTEKRLKRIAEERKKEAMASGDTPLSMNRAFQTRQEKVGQAHMVLSVGNRGAVPQVADVLGEQNLAKNKAERKRKEAVKNSSPSVTNLTDFTNTSRPSESTTPVPIGSSSPAPSGMKPGFSRIASETASRDSTPVPGTSDRTRVAFGFGTKRKATDDGIGTPSKR